MEYYLQIGSETRGPFTLLQLQSMWRSGSITGQTLYWEQCSDEWRPLSTMLEELEPPVQSPVIPRPKAAAGAPRVDRYWALLAMILICLIGVVVFGHIHVLTGGSLPPFRIVQKDSWGFSETFVDLEQDY